MLGSSNGCDWVSLVSPWEVANESHDADYWYWLSNSAKCQNTTGHTVSYILPIDKMFIKLVKSTSHN